jgi:ligand-binding SRPBCC domain-containing protein
MALHQLALSQWVPAPRSEVVRYFEVPENLGDLTPPFLEFRIRTPPPMVMAVGAQIEYTIALHGVPMRWLTLIDEYIPGERFVDVQLRGPYRSWRHVHTFTDERGGTRIADNVEFELPFGPLGELAYRLFVKKSLETIFVYRARKAAALFGGEVNTSTLQML